MGAENCNTHCGDHTTNAERIATLEKSDSMQEDQIAALFKKHDDDMEMMNQMKLCLERISGEMKAGFAEHRAWVNRFEPEWEEFKEITIEMKTELAEHRQWFTTFGPEWSEFKKTCQALKVQMTEDREGRERFQIEWTELKKTVKEQEEFKWFRDRVNKIKNLFLDYFVWGFGLIGALFILWKYPSLVKTLIKLLHGE